jgi:hypothetical protein
MRGLQHSPSHIALQRRSFAFLVTTMMDRGNMLVTMISSYRALEIASVAIRISIEMQQEILTRTTIRISDIRGRYGRRMDASPLVQSIQGDGL